MTNSHSEDVTAALELAKEEFGERFTTGAPFGDLTEAKLNILYGEEPPKSRLYRFYIASFPSVLQARIVELVRAGRTEKQIMQELACSSGHFRGTRTMAARLGLVPKLSESGSTHKQMERLREIRREKRRKRLESFQRSSVVANIEQGRSDCRGRAYTASLKPEPLPLTVKAAPELPTLKKPSTDGRVRVELHLTPDQMAKVMKIITE